MTKHRDRRTRNLSAQLTALCSTAGGELFSSVELL